MECIKLATSGCLFFFLSTLCLSESGSYIYPIASPYERFKALDSSGHHASALSEAITYLKVNPADGDVRLLLGQIYFKNKAYKKASEALRYVLKATPNYVDARLVLINVEMTQHHDHEALSLVNEGLLLDKKNKLLLMKKKNILLAIKKPKKIKKNLHEKQKKIEEVHYKNEIGIYQQQYYITDVRQVWDYSTVYYGHETPVGMVYGKVSYNQRFSTQAVQGEVEAFPKLSKYVYLDLDYAFANEPNLFPDKRYGVEAYVAAGKTFNFSAGGVFNRIDRQHQYSKLTGMVSRDFDKNRVTFRPFFFVPGVGRSSTLYTLNLRHTVRDAAVYFGCIFGLGTSPDLASLNTVNFLVVSNKIINPYLNFPLYNDRLLINLSYLYQSQLFPNNRIRDWNGATLGLVWKY